MLEPEPQLMQLLVLISFLFQTWVQMGLMKLQSQLALLLFSQNNVEVTLEYKEWELLHQLLLVSIVLV